MKRLSSPMFCVMIAFASILLARPAAAQLAVSASHQSLLDATNDYEVWSAPDTAGETEFVIWARFTDDGQWALVHRYEWTGSVDHGSMSDRGVYKFSTWWNAYRKAQNLFTSGEISDYLIEERDVEPSWQYEETFDTLAQAEAHADELVMWSIWFNNPHITKIVRVGRTLTFTRR